MTAPRGTWSPVLVGLVLVGLVAVTAMVALEPRFGPSTDVTVAGIRSAALVLSLLLAVTVHLHWRATGEASGAFISTAAWLLVVLALIDLASGSAVSFGPAVFGRSALSLVAAVWVGRAVTSTPVDAASRTLRELPLALLAVGGLVLGGLVLRAAGVADDLLVAALHILALSAWSVAAALGFARAVRGAPTLIGWVACLGVAFTASETGRVMAIFDTDDWLFASASARTAGLLVVAIGCVHGLAQTAVSRRRGLHVAELRTRELEDAHFVDQETRAHELRNALLSIEGASITLHRYRDALVTEDRERLSEAVSTGIAHLRSLVEPSCDPEEHATSLWSVASQRASLARARGMDVEVEGDRRLCAAIDRRALTQVLDNLLGNAARHAAGDDGRARVAITVLAVSDRAVVHVRDHGPGLREVQRELIFERGVRLEPTRDGDGIGLHLARQLVAQHGGELRVEEPMGGGARFVLSLPPAGSVPDGSVGGVEAPHEAQHGGQVVEPLRRAGA